MGVGVAGHGWRGRRACTRCPRPPWPPRRTSRQRRPRAKRATARSTRRSPDDLRLGNRVARVRRDPSCPSWVQARQEEHRQQGAGDQATQQHESHGVDDLETGTLPRKSTGNVRATIPMVLPSTLGSRAAAASRAGLASCAGWVSASMLANLTEEQQGVADRDAEDREEPSTAPRDRSVTSATTIPPDSAAGRARRATPAKRQLRNAAWKSRNSATKRRSRRR